MGLEETVRELADVFRQGGAAAQARTLDRLLAEAGAGLPERLLDYYKQGIGGIHDPYLRRDGHGDPQANERRDSLAARAYKEAQDRLRGRD